VLGEYRLAVERMGLSVADVVAVARTSLEVSSCPEPRRREALAALERWAPGRPA
jgi:adenosine deaminase